MVKKKRSGPLRMATRKPDRPEVVRTRAGYRPQPLRSDASILQSLVLGGEAQQQLMLLPALIWVDSMAYSKLPSNMCLDAAHTLRQVYLWLGMRANVIPVQLMVEPVAGSQGGTRYGNEHPHYNGDRFAGHCILHLPDDGRFIDATVGQFPEIARGTGAPIVGRARDGEGLGEAVAQSGSLLVVQREKWFLTYQPVEPQYANIVYEGPCATSEARFSFQENGMKIVAQMVAMLNLDPDVAARAQHTSSPRLGPLMTAVATARWAAEDDRLDLFTFPDGSARQLRDIPLPEGTAPPLP